MKKTIAVFVAALICLSAVLCGCSPQYDKSPDQYNDIRWITYDYSFCINPKDGCKGYYNFKDKKYNIKVTFDSSRLTAVDTDNSNTELFNADWSYETNDAGKQTLYVYNISFNKKDYEEFENNLAEYVTLKQEKI